MIDIPTLAGHLAFGLIAFSFLVKDILWLRLVSILASTFSVFYNYTIPLEPMWLAINWNIVFVLVNLYHIAIIIYEKRPISMAKETQEQGHTAHRQRAKETYDMAKETYLFGKRGPRAKAYRTQTER